MPNVNFELNLNKHPKDVPNRSLIYAKNVQVSNDLSCLQSEFSITEREDLAEILNNETYVAGYIPCNKEFILFIAPFDFEQQILSANGAGISIKIYRYKEEGDDAEKGSFNNAECKLIYENLIWHGGRIKGTFTYNIKSQLIISFGESDTIDGVLIPLKTMNLGTFNATNGNINSIGNIVEDCDLHLTDDQLSLNPEITPPIIDDYDYINGLSYKGWYYFFIRYKINSVDYTKWYSFGYPILINEIEKNVLFNYNINKEIDANGGLDPQQIYGYTSIVDQLSSGSNVCSKTLSLNIKHTVKNIIQKYKYFQIGFICTTKDNQRAFKSLDIETNIDNLNQYIINYNSLEEYNVNDFTFEKYNYYDVKNLINYKNRLYLSNYKEQIEDYNLLKDFADNKIKLGCTFENLYANTEYESYENQANKINIKNIFVEVSAKGSPSYSPILFRFTKSETDFRGMTNVQYNGRINALRNIDYNTDFGWKCNCKIITLEGETVTLNVSVSTGTIDGDNAIVFSCNYNNLSFKLKVRAISCGYGQFHQEGQFPIGSSTGSQVWDCLVGVYVTNYTNQDILTPENIYEFSSRRIINTFYNRLKNRSLIPNGYYKFYAHFINKYGEVTDGIPIRYNEEDSSGFDNCSGFNFEILNDDYLFHVPNQEYLKNNNYANKTVFRIPKLYMSIVGWYSNPPQEFINKTGIYKNYVGFFISYEKYNDVNDFHGVLFNFDFWKDNDSDPLPTEPDATSFTNYSTNKTNNTIFRFYSNELDMFDNLEIKSAKLQVLMFNVFDKVSYKDYLKKYKTEDGIREDRQTKDINLTGTSGIGDYPGTSVFDIESIKYVPAHSFIKNNDYRGSYLELKLPTFNVDNGVNGCICKLVSNDKFLYNSENKILIKCTNDFIFDNYQTIDDIDISAGLNGFITFNKALVYNNDKVILNTGYNMIVNKNYAAYTGNTNITEDEEHKVNNNNKYPFVAQYSFPMINEFPYETKKFNTLPEIIITRTEALNDEKSQAVFDYSTSVIVQPQNSIDLYKLPISSQDNNNPKTYVNYKIGFVSIFDKRIIRSNPIADESFENSWRIINPEAYKDITENKGNITNLIALGTTMLVHTEHSMFMFDRDNTLQNGAEGSVQLAMPDIFDVDYKEVIASELGSCGLQDFNAWVLNEIGYIFYDNDAHRFYKFGSKKIEIIDNSINQFIDKYKPYCVRFVDDPESNRLLVNIKYIQIENNINEYKEITLSYNYKINKWISIHDYVFDRGFTTKQMTYFIKDTKLVVSNMSNGVNDYYDSSGSSPEPVIIINKYFSNIYVINRKHIDFQNKDRLKELTYNVFENIRELTDNNNYSSEISIIVNDAYELIKTLEFITWKLYKIQKENNNQIDVPRKEALLPYSGDKIRIFNDSVDTGELDISTVVDENGFIIDKRNMSVMNYKKPWWEYSNWNFNYLRDRKNASKLKAQLMSRIYGNYFIINLVFSDTKERRIEFETLDCKLINNRTI